MVRVLDEGLWEGLPWYAMELLQGVPLRHLVFAQHSRPQRSLLTIVRRLCAPLGFIHGEGVVHRDLKPENVLLRPDGIPVLVDFGLMAQFAGRLGREELDLSAATSGTVAYMAPEQIQGELVDARADLYALGCVLYELLTGQQPFRGAHVPQIAWHHLHTAPAAPSTLVNGVPHQLDALVLALLAKRPRDRPGHADDVAAALANLGAEDGLTSSSPKARAYLYRAGLTGRDARLRELHEHLSGVQQGRGGLVLLGGESGVGKTRLAMELAREAGRRRLRVLIGEGVPLSSNSAAGGPLKALRPALQSIADRCRGRGPEETDRVLGPRGPALAVYEPALAGLPGQERYPEPAALPAEATLLRLYQLPGRDLRRTGGRKTAAAGSGRPAMGRRLDAWIPGVPAAIRASRRRCPC